MDYKARFARFMETCADILDWVIDLLELLDILD